MAKSMVTSISSEMKQEESAECAEKSYKRIHCNHGYGILKWPIQIMTVFGLFHFANGPHRRKCIAKLSVAYSTILSLIIVCDLLLWIYIYAYFSEHVAKFSVFFLSVALIQNAVDTIFFYIVCWRKSGIHLVIEELQGIRRQSTTRNTYLFTFTVIFIHLGLVASLFIWKVHDNVLKDVERNYLIYKPIFPSMSGPYEYKITFGMLYWFAYFSGELGRTVGTIIPSIYCVLLKREFLFVNKTFQKEIESGSVTLLDAICKLR